MGMHWSEINDDIRDFIEAQRLFFVATAPQDGLINVSPKGVTQLKIPDPKTVVYLDLTGSGNETGAHVTENGRITIMFCAFSGPPNIVRLYGKARIVLPESDDWSELISLFDDVPGIRQMFVIDVQRVSDSCGFGIPIYEYVRERTELTDFAKSLGANGLEEYKLKNNIVSIDGLPTGLVEDDF